MENNKDLNNANNNVKACVFSVTWSETNVVWFPNYVRSCYRFNMYNYGLLLIKLNRVKCCVNVLLIKLNRITCCVNK